VAVADDGDIVRGLGFVTMYAAWVEEDVDDLLRLLAAIEPFDEKKQRLQISGKLKHAAKLVRGLKSEELDGLPKALEGASDGTNSSTVGYMRGTTASTI
jgi:hypothetical protein